MKEISLTQGKVALVDDEDFKSLNQRKWHVCKPPRSKTMYAVAKKKLSRANWKRLRMHRLILNVPENMQVDHINGNGLDNRKNNLRVCTSIENMRNMPLRKDTISGFKGVFWDSQSNKWQAQIYAKKRRFFLGRYLIKTDAALAYNKAALKYHGEFARINQIS